MDSLVEIFGTLELRGKYIPNSSLHAFFLRSNFGLGIEFTSFGQRTQAVSLTPCCLHPLTFSKLSQGQGTCAACGVAPQSHFSLSVSAGAFPRDVLRAHVATFFNPVRFAFLEPIVGDHLDRIIETCPSEWCKIQSTVALENGVQHG